MAKLSTSTVFGDLLVDGTIFGNVTGNLTGNASTATSATSATSAGKWSTARTLTIGNTGKSVDGSANVSWTLAEIGALPLSGGTMTGKITTPNNAPGITIGDDITICDRNVANFMVLEGSNATSGGIIFGSDKDTNIYRGGTNILKTDDTFNAVAGFQWNGESLDTRYAKASHGSHTALSTVTPKVAGTAAVGSDSGAARGDHVHPAQTSVSGNAGTATTLQTARTLTIGASGKSFNGSANVTWSHNDIQVARTIAMPGSSSSVSYVKLITFSDAGSGNIHGEALISGIGDYGGDAHAICLIRISGRNNRRVEMVKLTPNSNGTVEIGYVRDDTKAQTTVYLKRATYDGIGKITILSEVGCAFETSLTSTTTAPTGYTAGSNQSMYSTLNPQTSVTGNAGTATKLQTARTLTIGSTGKTFDGSANVSWSLAEIGAFPQAGGTLSGNLSLGSYAITGETRVTAAGATYSDPWNGTVCAMKITGKVAATDTIKAPSFEGNATSATKLATARTITIGNKGNTFDGSGNITYSLSDIGAAASSHTHNQINSRGNVTCETGANVRPAVSGLSMTQAYNNGYPTTYGNVLNMRGGGDGQLLIGWSGTSGAHAPVYVRSRRDTNDADWSGWAQVYTTANKPTAADLGLGNTVIAINSNLTNVSIGGFDSMMTTVNSNLSKL